MDAERKTQITNELVQMLLEEREPDASMAADDAWSTFRALVNTRPPWPASERFLALQDELLQGLIAEAGIATIDDATPSLFGSHLRIWRGDITTLAVDAIVNAANSRMLGCWVPNHLCIDNAIHTFAGVQLRIECARIMELQGHEEPTGQAKITPAYNLPARYIIHTVGPIAKGRPTDEHRRQLASCYEECLNLAAEHGLSSIAFCGISTGVFGFPQNEAAPLAVRTVRSWLDENASDMIVIFNVFSERDEQIYRRLLFPER